MLILKQRDVIYLIFRVSTTVASNVPNWAPSKYSREARCSRAED